MSKVYTKNDLPIIIEKFNKNLKRLVKLLESNIVNMSSFDTLKRRLYIGMNETPILLLQKGGESIYNLKDYVFDKKIDELVNTSHNNIMSDDSDNGTIIELIDIIKEVWMKFNDGEKDYVYKVLAYLISEYSKYKLIQ